MYTAGPGRSPWHVVYSCYDYDCFECDWVVEWGLSRLTPPSPTPCPFADAHLPQIHPTAGVGPNFSEFRT